MIRVKYKGRPLTIGAIMTATVPGGPDGTCLDWIATMSHGRGVVWDGAKLRRVTHVVMEFLGHRKNNDFVLHKCDRPSCVNPQHLFLGTQADNMKDCKDKGRHAIGSRKGNAVLREEWVREIKKQLASGDRPVDIARKYGVAAPTIYSIRYGKSWRHI